MFNWYIMYYGMELNLTGKKMLGNCYCDGFIWSIYHHFLQCFFFFNFIHSGTFGKTSPPHGDLEMALLINGSLFCCLSVV